MDFTEQIRDNRRALVYGLLRRIEAWLEPFAEDLQGFLCQIFDPRLPPDWRERWHAFVDASAAKGFVVKPESVVELEAWIEAWAKRRRLLPEAVAPHIPELPRVHQEPGLSRESRGPVLPGDESITRDLYAGRRTAVFRFTNLGKSWWEYLNTGSWPNALNRAKILSSHNVATLVPWQVPVAMATIGARQGGSVFVSDLDSGEIAGSSGAQPCVILVIKGPGKGFVRAWHFQATDSVTSTLARDLAGSSGGRAGIAGDLEDDATGNALLAIILGELKTRNIPIDGYYTGDELWVDADDRWVKRR